MEWGGTTVDEPQTIDVEEALEGIVKMLTPGGGQCVFEQEQAGTVKQSGENLAVDGRETVTAFIVVDAEYGAKMYDSGFGLYSTLVGLKQNAKIENARIQNALIVRPKLYNILDSTKCLLFLVREHMSIAIL